MAKVIKYLMPCRNNQILRKVTMEWNESNEEIAKEESYNGEYTIEEEEE